MDLSNLDAARLLFGVSAAYHFLFVPLTIGLMAVIALFEACALRSGRTELRAYARFLTWPFVINFVCGVLSGYPLRWQLQTQWSSYFHVVKPVFDRAFGFEALVAPVMFVLVAAFCLGWRLQPFWHFLISFALALTLVAQSSAILLLNAWMQYPQGTEMVSGQLQIADAALWMGNPLLAPKIFHTIGGAWVLGGSLISALSAWYLLKGRCVTFARSSLKVASLFTVVALLITGVSGHWSGERIARYQPMKFAAIEALWSTDETPPDLVLFARPDQKLQLNRSAIVVPDALGLVVSHDGDKPLRGLRELSAGRSDAQPPVARVFWMFRAMVACWVVLLLVTAWTCCCPSSVTTTIGRWRLRLCVAGAVLPWIALEAGWVVCEAGRQPWTVTGVLLTRDSVGSIPAAQSIQELAWLTAAGLALLAVNVSVTVSFVRRGPAAAGRSWVAWQAFRRQSRGVGARRLNVRRYLPGRRSAPEA